MHEDSDINSALRKIRLPRVFTPSSYARLIFEPRVKQEYELNRALDTPQMQALLHGPADEGKSNLVDYILKTRKKESLLLVCTSVVKLLQQLQCIAIQLQGDMTKGPCFKKKTSIVGSVLRWLTNVFAAKESLVNPMTALPVPVLLQLLAVLLDEKGVILVIDHIERLTPTERQLVYSLQELASRLSKAKIILIATTDGNPRYRYENKLGHPIMQIRVPPMTRSQMTGFILKAQLLLNFEFTLSVLNGILKDSSSAAICHKLCFDACFSARVRRRLKKTRIIDSRPDDNRSSKGIGQVVR